MHPESEALRKKAPDDSVYISPSDSDSDDTLQLKDVELLRANRDLTPVLQTSEPKSNHSDSVLNNLIEAMDSSADAMRDLSLMEAQIVQDLVKEKVKAL